MGKPKAPTPPSAQDTASASTGTNVGTAIANTMMGNVNQIGADGSSLNYSQSGTYRYTDPFTGQSYDIPTFTATQHLSQPAQDIFNTNQVTQKNLADTGAQQSSFLKGYLGTPWQADTSAIESRIMDLGSRTLDPKFAQQKEALATTLSNQGIKLGSDAYTRAMADQAQQQNDAYSNLALQGRGQAFNELLTQRNQPINEITALLGGSQIAMPGYQPNTPSQIPTTDVGGLINQNYGQRYGNYQTQMAQRQSLLGGLFGLGSAGIMGL